MSRDRLKNLPSSGFRTADLLRLAAGVSMLLLLLLLILWAREADTWRWLVSEESPAPADSASPEPKSLPEPTGPTDKDLDEQQTAQEEFQVLTDGALQLSPEEMEPYDRLVRWVKHQSFEQLQARARKDLLYTHFFDQPEKYRGYLTMLKLHVRRALDAGKNRDDVQLHEVWGFSDESCGRPYVLVVVDYPPGMPMGPRLEEQALFVGYFLKLQGYVPAEAPPHALPEKAPLLIGRLKWFPAAVKPKGDLPEWLWWTVVFAAIVGLLIANLSFFRAVKKRKPLPSGNIPASKVDADFIDDWLERSVDSPEEKPANEDEKTFDEI